MNSLTEQLLEALAEDDPLNPFIDGAVPALDGRLHDIGEPAERDRRDTALAIAEAARTTRDVDQVTRAVVAQQADAIAVRLDARLVEHTVLDYNVAPLATVLNRLPRQRPEDEAGERHFLERLAAVPRFLSAAADRHRMGLATGRTPVAHRVHAAVARVDAQLAQDPANDPLRRPPLTGPRAAERERLLTGAVREALATYRDVLAAELAPSGRSPEQAGLCWLPDGEATYAALVGTHTTTDLSPEQIHRIGLEQVERVGEDYVALGSALFGARTVPDVRRRVTEDATLRWESPEQLLAVARDAIERADRAAPDWFGRLPSRRCLVAEVPATEAPHASAASYNPGSFDGSRPGTYYANTYGIAERDRSVAEAAAFHEVAGHHFQITLAQELPDLPLIRRSAWINAYLEGWALYSEHLADEAGLYSDDFYRLGMYAHDLTRATRLVVDTGLHALGWDRERAVEYLRRYSAMSELELQHETDRYIEMPGQALSYLIGRIEFDRLRERAMDQLGDDFDIRSFHDAMLGSGPLPLTVLDDVLARWAADAAG